MARRRKLWRSLDRLAESKSAAADGDPARPHSARDVDSPCNGYCRLMLSGLCRDCGRTLDEISGWMRFSPERKQAVLRAAATRLQDSR